MVQKPDGSVFGVQCLTFPKESRKIPWAKLEPARAVAFNRIEQVLYVPVKMVR